MGRSISQAGIDLIKSFEGCSLTAYNATGVEQYLTIGWGHYGADVTAGMTITQEQADAMFLNDIQRYVDPVNDPAYVTVTEQLNQNQFDALVSFCYNCGSGNLKDLCNGRTINQIADSLPLYNKGGGKVLAGLTRRRMAELALFNTEPQPIKEDDDDMDKVLDYPDWAWADLDQWAGQAYNDKIISDWSWVQKIRDKQLKYKELLLLKVLVDERRRVQPQGV